MNITAIFVELLIIGFGVLCWLGLFIAFVLGLEINSSLFSLNPIFIAPLTAIAYILGIVSDRIIRDFFKHLVEDPIRKKVLIEYSPKLDNIKKISKSFDKQFKAMDLEKFVRANSQDLGHKIDYNRNRLRICRAWVVHFLLITVIFFAWNIKVGQFSVDQQYWIVATGLILFAVTLHTSIKLAVDHQRDIIESSEIILRNKIENNMTPMC